LTRDVYGSVNIAGEYVNRGVPKGYKGIYIPQNYHALQATSNGQDSNCDKSPTRCHFKHNGKDST